MVGTAPENEAAGRKGTLSSGDAQCSDVTESYTHTKNEWYPNCNPNCRMSPTQGPQAFAQPKYFTVVLTAAYTLLQQPRSTLTPSAALGSLL